MAIHLFIDTNVYLKFHHFSNDDSRFNTFLLNEWENKKSPKIIFYKTLASFFKEVFPDIKLATELEKDILIAKLVESGNFYNSLHKLSKFDSFSTEQVNQYISASMNNSQILWISDDEDINEYLHNFAQNNKEKIEKDLLSEFYNIIPNLKVPPPPMPKNVIQQRTVVKTK